MSLILSIYTTEGIVMAADSRLTLHTEAGPVPRSDTAFKCFCTPHGLGIVTCDQQNVEDKPITGFIEACLAERLDEPDLPVGEAAQRLADFFGALPGPPGVEFMVGGYESCEGKRIQRLYGVSLRHTSLFRINPEGEQGIQWAGETDVLERLIQPVARQGRDGNSWQPLPYHHIPWNFFSLQDAIDFAIFAIAATIDTLRFQPRPKTVGGPIDVLVIKPHEFFFIQRKQLQVRKAEPF